MGATKLQRASLKALTALTASLAELQQGCDWQAYPVQYTTSFDRSLQSCRLRRPLLHCLYPIRHIASTCPVVGEGTRAATSGLILTKITSSPVACCLQGGYDPKLVSSHSLTCIAGTTSIGSSFPIIQSLVLILLAPSFGVFTIHLWCATGLSWGNNMLQESLLFTVSALSDVLRLA